MSSLPQIPQTNLASPKPPLHHDDERLSEPPSNLDLALNGQRTNYLSPNPTKSDSAGLLDPEAFRRLSISSVSSRGISPYPVTRRFEARTWRSPFLGFWNRNESLILVIVSQLFGALMNVTAQILEKEGNKMEPFQILFTRMTLTGLCCCLWMWWQGIALFGIREVRGLLVLRGFSGFFGIFGMYFSLKYLPMADAVVITFLAPSVAAYACYLFLREPFPRSAQLASLVSLLGVVLIARPASFFSFSSSPDASDFAVPGNGTAATTDNNEDPIATSTQRLTAVIVALLGVVGSAGAFTAIRLIGSRAHPLVSVNYFSIWCTIVSTVYLLATDTFALPSNPREWTMLIFLGVCGFIMQYLLTRGLAGKDGGVRATNMIYTNMLFALGLDRWVFGVVPGWWSLAGSGLILASAVYVAMSTTGGTKPERASDEEVAEAEETRAILENEEEVVNLGDLDTPQDRTF